MKPILFEEGATSYATNGIGRLSDAISCVVTEERNGSYELEMKYPVGGRNYDEISHSRIIAAIPHDGGTIQGFRIYKIKRQIDSTVTVYARHVSYQLSMIPCRPFSATTCAEALVKIKANAMEDCPFTFWTDKGTAAKYEQTEPASIRSRLGGTDGSILDAYGGEYEFDNFTVRLHASRGSDRGARLAYGKNITDIRQEQNIENACTGIVGMWKNGTEAVFTDAVYGANADAFPYHRTRVVDFTSDFQEEPTMAQLASRTQSYAKANALGVPAVSIDVSFVALWQTEEYKDIAPLERVRLCDTVTVSFEMLGIEAKAKVVKTAYNVLLERYDRIEIGDARPGFTQSVQESIVISERKTDSSLSQLHGAINDATALIRNGFGGYVTMRPNADGIVEEILIMDAPTVEEAVKVWRWNMGGLGYSSTGYDGEYRTAVTADGHFVADFVDTGTLTANIVRAGILADTAGRNYWNLQTGEFSLSANATAGGSSIATESSIAKAVVSTDVEYGNSDSSSAKPSVWTTNASWQKGKYLWTRVKMTLKDGSTEWSDASIVAAGTGLGVSGVKEQYYLSTSNATQTGGSWSDTQQAWVKSRYYWTRSEVTWSDGSTTYTAPVLAQALTSGNQSTDTLDSSLGQTSIFNRLTNNGATQGIYLSNGKLYINATYIATGTLKDANSNTTFNLSTGELTMTKGSINLGKQSSGSYNLYIDDNGKIKSVNNSNYFNGCSVEIDGGYVRFHSPTTGSWGSGSTYLLGYDTFLNIASPQILIYDDSKNHTQYEGAILTITGWTVVNGNFQVTGTKSRTVKTKDYGTRSLYCYETPTPLFGDIGEGETDDSGKCCVFLDEVFSETIADSRYQVFLQKYGEGDVYVAERGAGWFVVHGTPGLRFGWEVKAAQKGYAEYRLDEDMGFAPVKEGTGASYIDDALEDTETLIEEAWNV